MQIHCAYDKLVNINELKPHPKNPNKHPKEQIQRLAKIIETQGFRRPITVSKLSGFVTVGHGRLEAAKLIGMSQVPVNFQDYDSEDLEYADMTADNAIASWAELQLAEINKELENLGPDFDIDLLGLRDFELELADKYADKDADSVPEVKTSIVKPGDLWILGNHRLLCGDSTDIDDIERLMDGELADFTITSPPYNVGLDYTLYDDNKSEFEYELFLTKIIENCKKIATSHYWLLWNVGVYPLSLHLHLHLHLLRRFFKIKRAIAWIKSGITGPPLIYHMQQNPVVKNYQPNFGWEIIACCNINDKFYGTKKIHEDVMNDALTDVWNISQHSNSNDQGNHPGAFPILIPKRAIELYCENNIYEPFGGSGSTLIAAEMTDRRAFVMEIDPHYCTVILERWAKFTGKDPVREDGVKLSELQA